MNAAAALGKTLPKLDAAEAERLALEAEARIQPSETMDEREYWQILANRYWAKA